MTRPVTLIGSTERGRLVELLRLRRNGRDSGLREYREPYRADLLYLVFAK